MVNMIKFPYNVRSVARLDSNNTVRNKEKIYVKMKAV